jgi:glutaconyl-CoA/methylmalonyl-CoA decarboxylase subunit delta
MENLGFGIWMAVLGMGIVFGLLLLLWILLEAALRFESRRPAAVAPEAPGVTIRRVGGPTEIDPGLVAAIAVAIARHAEQGRRQAAPAMRSSWPGSLLFASRWVAAGRMRQGQPWRRR